MSRHPTIPDRSTTRPRVTACLVACLALVVAAVVPTTASARPDRPTRDSFDWVSSQPVITPQPVEGRNLVSTKDPSVVQVDGTYHVFMTMFDARTGWTMATKSFDHWSQADDAEQYMLDQSGIGRGYRAAPQVFWFEPQGLWYLVYQSGQGGSYSTTDDIDDPSSWTPPRPFYPGGMPDIIADNIGNGYWVDFWTICDDQDCHLFSSDDNGHLYRSETSVEDFPNGFEGSTVITKQEDDRALLYEAANVYRITGTDQYLLLVEAIGSDGRRWFRSWTSDAIEGPWDPLADTEGDPFARSTIVHHVRGGDPWTVDTSHGELVRDGIDQTLTIDPCERNVFLYQGLDPEAGGDYGLLPYRLGLLTQHGPDPLDAFCTR